MNKVVPIRTALSPKWMKLGDSKHWFTVGPWSTKKPKVGLKVAIPVELLPRW